MLGNNGNISNNDIKAAIKLQSLFIWLQYFTNYLKIYIVMDLAIFLILYFTCNCISI